MQSIKKWLLSFKVRRAKNITDAERETCERYGEHVIGTMLASGVSPTADDLKPFYGDGQAKIHARDWLTERADIQARRDKWIPLRDFILEIVVIALIGWEIRLSYKQEKQQSDNFNAQQKIQSDNFNAQQQILTNLNNSSKATADTLTALKETTDLELAALKESATTSAKALHISERPYVACAISLPAPPKDGEKLHFGFTIRNSGKSTAVDVKSEARLTIVSNGTSDESARTQAFLHPLQESGSTTTLASDQQMEQALESKIPLTESLVADITAEKILVYAFSDIKYEDVFAHKHHTKTCVYYSPVLKATVNCHSLNKAD